MSPEAVAWVEIYKGYSAQELDWEIKQLREQNTIFVTQNVGSKSFSRDLNTLRDRLQAATRVKGEPGPNVSTSGNTDFSRPCDPLT